MCTYLIDDFVSLFITEQMLCLEGFRGPIVPFAGANEALAYLLPRLDSELPEFIFLDLNMPVMDGWGFLDALAPHAPALQGRCRIYLLTSSLALGDREKASENALVQGIMYKPLEEERIRAILLERDRRPPATAPNIPASRREEAI